MIYQLSKTRKSVSNESCLALFWFDDLGKS